METSCYKLGGSCSSWTTVFLGVQYLSNESFKKSLVSNEQVTVAPHGHPYADDSIMENE